jgi:CMP-N-acetylneuraminic acid synthetase
MRHTSERVSGKNYRPLRGRPLYHHITETLLKVGSVDEVVIDTDSEFIKADAERTFPNVRIVTRPRHLRSGTTPMNDVLLNTLEEVDADLVVQTHSTNPFLRSETLEAALQEFINRSEEYDSSFSVTKLQARMWSRDAVPINHDRAQLLRTQDLEPVFIENSCFFIFTPGLLRASGTRIGAHPQMIEMDPLEAVDIDTEHDWAVAEALAERLVRD